ncbi:MAG TPA: maleylpyruvate isomerase family mycothiol-dependent enzyme [Acidimicrobiales bacterium]|nr:maleylpyruvate isomerase family mycothiol-dependent enzyme [Acidimicrobiales bacterium]
MSDRLPVLRESVRHLSDVASKIGAADYTSSAYPSDWTVADTFSHLGSGAVIGQRRFEDAVAHRESDPAFNASVWDEWNAKDPTAQVEDCLASDVALLAALETSTGQQRDDFRFMMGPFAFDFNGLVGLRLSEHVLHTWDVEVPFYPRATLPNDAANAILDSIQFIVARTAKPTGETKHVTVRTIDPVRDFSLVLDVDSVDLVEAQREGAVDLEISAEALVRLIYGRLDEEHSPTSVSVDAVDYLRRVFPGF